jgi:cytoskeletal protein CcmA (bactofilin family)
MGIFGGKPPEAKPAGPTEPPRPASPPAPRPAPAPPPTPCVIGAKTTVAGTITGDEDILVLGTVEGEIRIGRDLTIGPGGTVRAQVHARAVMISGELIGDLEVSGRVEIQSTGRLVGNIRAPRVVIAEGAVFRGSSDMSDRKSGAA